MFEAPVHNAEEGRLPRHVVPHHYSLHLRPDLVEATFAGIVAIEAEVIEANNAIVLNAADLMVTTATVTNSGHRNKPELMLDSENERLVLTNLDLQPGPVRIELAFTGVLNDRLRGFYRSTLVVDGKEHVIATTQFQSTDARRAFPCFDEPDRKATFSVTLDVPSGMLAVSNAAEVSRVSLAEDDSVGATFPGKSPDGAHDRVIFADTIPLPTYLVAFVIGPLEATPPVDVDGIPVRVIHPPGRGDQTAFALEVASHSLRWLADWYGIAIPGEKVDLVALPDFAFGAMENLGCITFREVLLLVDPATADQRELESVSAVLSHELAHLWFGDLVTMSWWNGIWLNEAFATFMEMKAVEAFRPEWEVWTGFTTARSAALDVDALAATRPIEYPVVTPTDAESMFDLLTYEKGAAVVRMLEQYLGEGPFRDGVRHYLSTHLGGNTDNNDLWAALEETTGEPVGDLMEGWIFQGGHPVVEVSNESGVCRISQRRFRYLSDGEMADESTPAWTVPLRLRTDAGEYRLLLGSEPVEIALDRPLLTANAGATGFHRTFGVDVYDAGALTATERASAVDDRWAATLAGLADPLDFPVFVTRFVDRPGGEDDLAVWQAILHGLSTIDLVAPERHRRTAAEAGSLLAGIVEQLGWEPGPHEDDRTRQLRGAVLAAAGTLADDGAVIGEARRRWCTADSDSDPAVAAAVVSIVASHGDTPDRARCRSRVDEATTAQDEQRHLRALALFPSRLEVDSLLSEIDDGTIRTQDAPFLLRAALTPPAERAYVWTWMVDQWQDLNSRLPSNSVARMLEGIRALVVSHQPNVDVFLGANAVPQGGLTIDQHRERRHVNLRLRKQLLSGF
ncbi:MAG TPA: hypothetical protein DCR10_04155 [Acidimicrobiaceae bacterium]|nr:hypothetical protein [Acidimicrobiaceae bacterium]